MKNYIIFLLNQQMLWLIRRQHRGHEHSKNSLETGPQLQNFTSFNSIIPMHQILKWKPFVFLSAILGKDSQWLKDFVIQMVMFVNSR